MKSNYLYFGRLALVVVSVALLAAGCSTIKMSNNTTSTTSNTTSFAPPSNTDPNTIIIQDYNFVPPTLTVKKGTTVKWVNKDSVRHNVVGDNGKGPQSDLLAQEQSYSFTFNEVGTFSYKCEPHPYMKGAVIVTD